MIKINVLESKAGRLKLEKSQLNVEAWLLARQSMAVTGTPKRFHKSIDDYAKERSESDEGHSQAIINPGNHPRGINRLSMVADLINSEMVAKKKNETNAEDSGLESGHSSMNTSSDNQSDVEGSQETPPFSPAGQSSHSSVNPGPVPDVVRTSLQARKRCDSFNMQTSQRKHPSKYNNLPVTIV